MIKSLSLSPSLPTHWKLGYGITHSSGYPATKVVNKKLNIFALPLLDPKDTYEKEKLTISDSNRWVVG